MKCYYEVLEVKRDASDSDIRNAYRRLALKWHPDKNRGVEEEAKERFQLIQQAYEVLSDAHERTWYDNHREQILRGKDSNYEENCLDLYQYFTVSCYKGYGNDDHSFYHVYREVFEKIAAEDAEFMEDDAHIPTFGNSESGYDEVGIFYAYWQAYCTKKTFTWLCPYNIQEIKDRRILREIEKEMKKIVQKAKRERNEEVRNLVSFVRKRDRRVQAYKRHLEERAALNRKKQEQNRLDQIRRRQRELESTQHMDHNQGNYEELLKQLEQEYDSEVHSEVDDEQYDNSDNLVSVEEGLLNCLYCVVCNKAFKNENAFTNHELSKKHRENMMRVKLEMQDEEQQFELNVLVENRLENNDKEDESLVLEDTEQPKAGRKNKKSRKNNKALLFQTNASYSENEEIENEKSIINTKLDSSDEELWPDKSNALKKCHPKKNKFKKQLGKLSLESNVVKAIESVSKIEDTLNTVSLPSTPTHVCVTCKANFSSKNKLFSHLKLTNHSIYIPKAIPDNPDIPHTSKKIKEKKKQK